MLNPKECRENPKECVAMVKAPFIAAELNPYGEKASLSGCDLFVNPTRAKRRPGG